MKRLILFGVGLSLLCGCSTFNTNWKKHLPWSAEARLKASKFESPAKMVAIWTPDILTQTGKPPTRGFGGRLYFYNDTGTAIPVEGQLMVFAYDDSAPKKHPNGDPDRKYAFTPEQFKTHFSESDLGASYSVWIPWDAVGGDQKNISLVPVFTATSGKVVMGQQAMNVLPGRKSADSIHAEPLPQISRIPAPTGIQPVAHLGALQNDPNPNNEPTGNPSPTRMRTSTINVPPSLQRRLLQNPVNPNGNQQAAGDIQSPEGNWGIVRTSSESERFPDINPTAKASAAPSSASLAKPPADSPRHSPSARFERLKLRAREAPDGPTFPVVAAWRPSPATPLSVPQLALPPTMPTRIPAISAPLSGNAN